MALADALTTAKQAPPKHPQCSIALLLADIPADDAAALAAALGDETFGHYQIGEALRASYPDRKIPDDTTLSRHRRGKCSCR